MPRAGDKFPKADKDRASDAVSPPVSDSTMDAIKGLMGKRAVKTAEKGGGPLPRKGWGGR